MDCENRMVKNPQKTWDIWIKLQDPSNWRTLSLITKYYRFFSILIHTFSLVYIHADYTSLRRIVLNNKSTFLFHFNYDFMGYLEYCVHDQQSPSEIAVPAEFCTSPQGFESMRRITWVSVRIYRRNEVWQRYCPLNHTLGALMLRQSSCTLGLHWHNWSRSLDCICIHCHKNLTLTPPTNDLLPKWKA